MMIPIGADHAGFEAKEWIKDWLVSHDYEPVDFGTHSSDSVDYPDYAAQVTKVVGDESYPLGIIICGTGQGVCMTANKHPKIRAALVWNDEIASLSRTHNNANVLCLPARHLSKDEMLNITQTFLKTEFEGGRHQRRVEKIETATKDFRK